MEKKIVVGMGEALWDVLPEGRKSGALRPISLTMSRSSGLTAVWSAPSAMILSATKS